MTTNVLTDASAATPVDDARTPRNEATADADSRPLRVLMITHRTPYPPDKGDRIRSYQILRYLAQHARVDLATLADEPVGAETSAALSELTERVAIVPVAGIARWAWGGLSFARGRSITEGLFYSPELHRRLRKWTAETRYDAVIVVCSSMAQYLTSLRLNQTTTLVDLIDVDSQKWFDYAAKSAGLKKRLYRLEARRVAALEADLSRKCDRILLTTEDEVACLRSISRDAQALAVPNGVDFDYFHPNEYAAVRTNSCVFVGALDYKPNVDGVVWFCDRVWPLIVRQLPEAQFTIVGRRPVEAVKRLAARRGVRVVADVPDVRPYLWESAVAVAPLQVARGVQNKVLEAMASGTPMVVSPAALVGLGAVGGEHLSACRSEMEWQTTLLRLFQDADLRQRFALAGRRYVFKNHRWDNCLAAIRNMLESAPLRRVRETSGVEQHSHSNSAASSI